MFTVEVQHMFGGPADVMDNDWQICFLLVTVNLKNYAALGTGATKGEAVWDAIKDVSKQAGTDSLSDVAGAVIQAHAEAIMDATIDVRGLFGPEDLPF